MKKAFISLFKRFSGVRGGGYKKGLSLLLAVVLINVIVLFSVGVTRLVIDSARQAGNVRQGTQAYYAAEAGLEKALLVNKLLTEEGKNVGASEEGDLTDAQGTATGDFDASFTISGKANDLAGPATVEGKYIIPFPWTGNVPWHGEGAIAEVGGCDPQKPPEDNGNNQFHFTFFESANNPDEDGEAPLLDHPCNWGKLAVGEKVSIPLYGLDDGGNEVKFDDFILRVRTPCAYGNEMCPNADTPINVYRKELNCFDKGSEEKMCLEGLMSGDNKLKGEVVLLWQINGSNNDTMKPYIPTVVDNKYSSSDTQLFEGKINNRRFYSGEYKYSVLNTNINAFPFTPIDPFPKGLDLSDGKNKSIKQFINETNQPVLTLTGISSLIGCENPIDCDAIRDNIDFDEYKKTDIPYLEYQLVLVNAIMNAPPLNKENIITAEGQSGSFVQNIQVKVNNDNSGLEYVIQQ